MARMQAKSAELEAELQRLELEGASGSRAASLALDSPARRSARRSHRSDPFFIGVAGGTASGARRSRGMGGGGPRLARRFGRASG